MLTLKDANHLLSQSTPKAVLMLCGDAAVREIAMALTLTALANHQRILWIEAANVFDLYALTETAKRWNMDPHPFLRRLRIARMFTVHQMETLLTERLGPDLSRSPGTLTILSDPLALCWDEALPETEARRVLRRVAAGIEDLRRQGHRLLVTCPDPPDHIRKRTGLESLLRPVATRTFRLHRTPERLTLQEN